MEEDIYNKKEVTDNWTFITKKVTDNNKEEDISLITTRRRTFH